MNRPMRLPMQSPPQIFISASLLVVGVIHLLPLQGLLGTERLTALYAVVLDDPNLLILMRHRALLFGLLGGFLVWASFRPSLQFPGLIAGMVSVTGFLVIALQTGEPNDEITRVFVIDLIALALLAIALTVYVLTQFKR